MRELWRRIRTNWNRTDTLMLVSGLVSTLIFIGNCWWESVVVCYVALAAPLAAQLVRVRFDREALKRPLILGSIVGWCWPFGEGVFVRVLGWWGEYIGPGPMIWDTALYCVLVGWAATATIVYWGHRVLDIGYGPVAAVVYSGVLAFLLGLLGENLFVGANMWVYHSSDFDWWGIPAFLPIAYGIGYGILPLLRRMHVALAALIFMTFLCAITSALGLIVGFFPR
jgi:hypothetical protein